MIKVAMFVMLGFLALAILPLLLEAIVIFILAPAVLYIMLSKFLTNAFK